MSESKIEIGGNADDNTIVAGNCNKVENHRHYHYYQNNIKTSVEVPKRIINSIAMEFVYIISGTFMMGSSKDEPDHCDDETMHEVMLSKGFYMQTTQVTQKQWLSIIGNSRSQTRHDGNCPAEYVSWDDAQEFIRKLNEKEGMKRYRLPTEAEWEYACRAGTRTPFAFGKDLSTNQANYNGKYPLVECPKGEYPKGEYRKKTMPVRSFSPNAYGLYDMHGNVFEWCEDLYGDYPSGAVTDPVGYSGSDRVIRGGNWESIAQSCRSASRMSEDPEYRDKGYGFRLVRDV